MSDRTVSVLDGSTFVLGDRLGDVRPGVGREHGFFAEDTRFVSRWVLAVDDTPLQLLSLHQGSHFDARFVLTPDLRPDEEVPCSVVRHRLVGEVWTERVTVINHLHGANRLTLTVEIDTDFADLFEVKDAKVADREIVCRHDATSLTLGYVFGPISRSVTVAASVPAAVTRHGFTYALELAHGEQWSVDFTVTPLAVQPGVTFAPRTPRRGLEEQYAVRSAELAQWLAAAPILDAEDPVLERTYRASLSDLGALRMRPDLGRAPTLPAAGLPWFMALFGRDSLITSLQTVPYIPELAATTLRMLAAHQADTRDDFHEMEPGKILHELRFGELTARGDRPHSPYFGSADATPLFLICLDEYHRWTGDGALVRELEPSARAALAWIAGSGDPDGDGYVEYERRNPVTGLVNQCWKDSWNSIQFADGRLARGPIAICEIQGYAYDAQRRGARLAREVWDDLPLAAQLDARADALRDGFRRDFWIPERGIHALALDGDKRQVDSLTSDIGHLLWSGIVDDGEAAVTAERLLGDELYSGWGIRTLGAGEAGYNPLGYHTGTIWPHDNSLIAAGLVRYGHREAAATVASAMLTAATYFEHRLPEVFAGFPREMTSVPVAFPTASRPQAWAAGAPLLMLTALLDLRPGQSDVERDLPAGIGRVSLRRPGHIAPLRPVATTV